MPADATIQNALIVIAVALSVQTVLMLCTVVVISVALKRAHAMFDTQLNRFGERLDDMATQTRVAVNAIERSSAQINTMLHDAGGVLHTVGSFVAAPRTLLMTGVASVASAFSRWRRSRHQHQQHAEAR